MVRSAGFGLVKIGVIWPDQGDDAARIQTSISF